MESHNSSAIEYGFSFLPEGIKYICQSIRTMPGGYSAVKQDVHIVYRPIRNFRDNIDQAKNLVKKGELNEAIRMVVTSFETYCRQKFEAEVRRRMRKKKDKGEISQSHIEKVVEDNKRRFQNLEYCKKAYKDHLGIDLPAINQKAWYQLVRPFQKRHHIVHAGGIIDEDYIEKMKRIGNEYKEEGLFVGGRIEISEEEAKRAISNVEKIVEGIETLCP